MFSFPLDKGGRGGCVLFRNVELILGFTINNVSLINI